MSSLCCFLLFRNDVFNEYSIDQFDLIKCKVLILKNKFKWIYYKIYLNFAIKFVKTIIYFG